MEIRSVTLFSEPTNDLSTVARFFEATNDRFAVPLQTRRVAFPPFPGWWNAAVPTASQAGDIAARWQQAGADYLCLGPVQLQHDVQWLERLPEILAATGVLFASAEIADTNGHIGVGRCHTVARLIKNAALIRQDGFGNLYLTALANCPPGSPFFPVAYQQPGAPTTFALALEAADLALTAIQGAASLSEARSNLQAALESQARELQATAEDLARSQGIAFGGIDFSLAPYPKEARSLAAALEALGPGHIAAPGSLFAAAFIAEAVDRAHFHRCGFSGLMLPVLEDAVLARRAAQRRVTVSDLLNFAAVCGVGLDTIPLPGDIAADVLAGILLDVAALATRLRKPLTARLMPLPGLAAGDAVHFDFPYFADSRVMSLTAAGVSGLLSGDETISLRSLESRRGEHGS